LLPRLLPPRCEQAFGIISYHRVAPRLAGHSRPPLNVTPTRLGRQLQGLLQRGYVAWPLERVVSAANEKTPVPRNVFVVVFDDGFENVFRFAFPILRQLGVPATIFLPTAWLDHAGPFPFDSWTQAGDPSTSIAWQPLRAEQCARMLDSGLISLGSHTHTHQDFRGRDEAFADDVRQSVVELQQRFGIGRPTFSLPFGFCERGWPETVRNAGLTCCLTTDSQLVTPDADPFFWGRFGAEQYDTAASLAAKLDGWYSLVQNAWRRWRDRKQPNLQGNAIQSPSSAQGTRRCHV
jgi:peptidoglycan/xylan/chitin deacetylase (PgdA/CDA1 family)